MPIGGWSRLEYGKLRRVPDRPFDLEGSGFRANFIVSLMNSGDRLVAFAAPNSRSTPRFHHSLLFTLLPINPRATLSHGRRRPGPNLKAPSPCTRRSAPPPTNPPLTAYHPPLRPLCLPAQAGSSLRVLCVALFSDLGQTCQLPCLHRFAASLHSFLPSFPLFSTACSLFSKNTRGGGTAIRFLDSQ